jgi:hypothetical protein
MREAVLERAQRRFVAIPSADVAGYGRFIGEDKTGTLGRLKGEGEDRQSKHQGTSIHGRQNNWRRDPQRVSKRFRS